MKLRLLFGLAGLIFSPSASAAPVNVEGLMKRLSRETVCSPLGQTSRYSLQEVGALSPDEAEILAEYGFHSLSEQKFRCQGDSLVVQIYRMLDSVAAYGVFTFHRAPDSRIPDGFPRLAEESQAWIAFAQSNLYVRIHRRAGYPSRATALKTAQWIARAVPTDWSVPSIVHHLPREHLIAGSEVFVMGHRALNRKYPFGSTDLFGLAHGAEAVLADYRLAKSSAKLLLMIYPTQQLARKYLKIGYEQHTRQHPERRVFYKREGPLVVMVLDSTGPDIASSFLDKVSYVSSVSWDPQAEPLSVGRMMVNVFIYVGVVIGLTLLAGLLFGLLRVLLSWLFPGRIFNRTQSTEFIRLQLHPLSRTHSLPADAKKTSDA